MVALGWRHCSCSLSNYVSKFLSNLLATASYMDFCSMDSASVLYSSDFILSILLKSSVFKILSSDWCALAPFLRVRYFLLPLAQFIFLLKLSHLPIVQDNYFRLVICKREIWLFNLLSAADAYFFIWAIFVLSFIWIL